MVARDVAHAAEYQPDLVVAIFTSETSESTESPLKPKEARYVRRFLLDSSTLGTVRSSPNIGYNQCSRSVSTRHGQQVGM